MAGSHFMTRFRQVTQRVKLDEVRWPILERRIKEVI